MTLFTTRRISLISSLALATTLFAGAAQAADSNDRITPPNPNDVAILRGLLALQHPALRQGTANAPAMPATAAPAALTTEPGAQQGQAPGATEGEACVAPGAGSAACGFQAESNARLGATFRVSLDRAMAAAGFDSERL